ncbi:MAG: EVE domain-containing protein [Candidatus Pacebacteria bacterium]|nr:EVE domain-containing protein [Candidatus Paceibacterota bacterium]
MAKNYFLLRSEPDTYSIDDLKREKKTAWTGVRNYQARNNLLAMQAGDLCLFYHTGDEKAVVGVAKVVGKPYADKEDPAWTVVDVAYVKTFKNPVTLATIKADKHLAGMPLIKAARLSVQPVSQKHFEYLTKIAF